MKMQAAAELALAPLTWRAVLATAVPAAWAGQGEGVPLLPGDAFDVSPCDDPDHAPGRCWMTEALCGPWHMPHWCLSWEEHREG